MGRSGLATRRHWLLLVLVGACTRPAPPADGPVRASVSRSGNLLVVRAIPAPGTRINALQPPLLETPSGVAVRLTSTHVTADTAYFLSPPEVRLPAATSLEGAVVHVSVCDDGAVVCRVLSLPL